MTVQDPATAPDAEIITALPIPLAVAGHHQPAPFYVTADMFGGLPVQLAGGELSKLVGKPVAAPHTHDVDELYFLVSPEPGQARIEVRLDGVRHTLVSPAVMRIPAGSEHCFLTQEAVVGSYCFGILVGDHL
ncbi:MULTISPECIES: cupin domain-containing protein [unclassified Streptomyces]|uniref:cupin domain-containing protein n=1 Tax=unclassified Streptomyces TaxID=2593676 RepID=UPI002E12173A|nr:cupin domain-containing protein [Streptomyces sp. NBC_01197]WSS51422.1 cupin domain-containing protein [Streptomyces sp. NBC_01180]